MEALKESTDNEAFNDEWKKEVMGMKKELIVDVLLKPALVEISEGNMIDNTQVFANLYQKERLLNDNLFSITLEMKGLLESLVDDNSVDDHMVKLQKVSEFLDKLEDMGKSTSLVDVKELDLSGKIINTLLQHSINNVGDVIKVGKKGLMKIRGFNEKTIKQINIALKKL